MVRSFVASLIALVTMAGIAVSVSAGPISGTLSGDATLTPTGAPGVFTQNYTGDGNDTTFGSFTVQSTSTVDFSHPTNVVISDGMFTETFSAGILFGTTSGEGTASGVGTATFTADVVFTGGTGLFAGATGGATGLQMLMTTGPTTVSGSGTYVGTLSLVPEPSSLALLAPAAFFVFNRRRWAIAGCAFLVYMLPPLPRCSRWAYSSLKVHSSVSAFPDSTIGSACTSTFSRFARRLLTFFKE